jgi:molybdopterin-containing oxidoreductase family membrane subunit
MANERSIPAARPVRLSLLAILGVLFVAGVAAYARQVTEGMAVTGLRSLGTSGGASWGLYIVLMVYLVGVGFTSLIVVALVHLRKASTLRPLTRAAEVLAVVSFLLAGLGLLVDIGQPLRGVINSFRYARPGSPFFGTFTLAIAGGLIASLTFLYLDARRLAAERARGDGGWIYRVLGAGYRGTQAERDRHARAGFGLAVAVLPLLWVAISTEGFVFGLQAARPGWYGSLQAPAFTVLSAATGIGVLTLVAALTRALTGHTERIPPQVFRLLGDTLLVLLVVYLYFLVVEVLTHGYAATEDDIRMTDAFLRGTYAPLYRVTIAFLVIPILLLAAQRIRRTVAVGPIVASALLVALAGVGRRYVIIVPSQTHGSMLPYAPGSYVPTWNEVAVATGLLALGGLLVVGLAKLFPLTEVGPERGELQRPATRGSTRRRVLVGLLVASGFALQAVSYLFLAAPLGTPTSVEFSEPRLPFAPALFILGVLLVFLAAVAYEVLPDRLDGPEVPAPATA